MSEFLEKLPEVMIQENWVEGMMALSTRNYTIIKVVQVTSHRGDTTYSVSRGM